MPENEYQSEYMVTVGERPWGYYVVLANEKDIKIKRITVNPGQRLSLQKHHHRQEHWFIHQGQAVVTLSDKDIHLTAGQAIDIPCQHIHRIANTGQSPLVFIEIQTGSYFGEDDIERLEDDYKR